MTADLLDILTAEEAKRQVGIPDANTDQDDEIGIYITAISRRIDELCGPVVCRTVTGELHDGGCTHIRPKHVPVASFSSVAEYVYTAAYTLTAETNTAKTGYNYLWDEVTQLLYRRSGGGDSWFPAGRHNIAITYVAGRAATTSAVDDKFRRAAGIILTHLWRVDRGGGTETFGSGFSEYPTGFAVPARAMELLGDDLRARTMIA